MATEAVATDVRQKVRIYRRDSRWVIDANGREVPDYRALYPYLPATLRVASGRYYTVSDAVAGGVNPQIVTNALAAWYTEHPNTEVAIEIPEGESQVPDNMAYLSLGETIYKMVPIRQVGVGKAIRLMREKVRAEYERIATGLRAQAEQEAQGVIARANEHAARVRAEAERLSQNRVTFPRWAAEGYVLKHWAAYATQCVLIHARMVIRDIAYKERHWKPVLHDQFTVPLWVPLNANQELVHCYDHQAMMPHINANGSCMKIGEAIKDVTNVDTLVAFVKQIERTMSTINLASLLIGSYQSWHKGVQAALPPSIKAWIDAFPDMRLQQSPDAIRALPTSEAITEGAQETWSI